MAQHRHFDDKLHFIQIYCIDLFKKKKKKKENYLTNTGRYSFPYNSPTTCLLCQCDPGEWV